MQELMCKYDRSISDFKAIVDYIEQNYAGKCSYEVTNAESVSLISLWYIDENDRPTWMNISVHSINFNQYFEFEMQLLDEHIDETKKNLTSRVRDVIEWIDQELGRSAAKCDFQEFMQ